MSRLAPPRSGWSGPAGWMGRGPPRPGTDRRPARARRVRPDPRHGELRLPLRRPRPARIGAQLPRRAGGGGEGSGRHPDPVPVLCRDHGHDGRLRPRGDADRPLRGRRLRRLAPRPLLPERRLRQRARPVGRRAVGGAGPDRHAGGRGSRRRPGARRHGRGLGRRLDQHDPALLGPARPGSRGSRRAKSWASASPSSSASFGAVLLGLSFLP